MQLYVTFEDLMYLLAMGCFAYTGKIVYNYLLFLIFYTLIFTSIVLTSSNNK